MKILIIHPKDPSTKFLEGIYQKLSERTVISGGINKIQLLEYIRTHDRVIMCGHGSPSGLFSVGQFPDSYPYIIDSSTVKYLKNKLNNLYIWCNADQYLHSFGIQGLCTGMFISEVREALYYNFPYTENLEHIIQESNYRFSSIVGRFINQPLDIQFKNLISQYGELGKTNPIADFNCKRIYLKYLKFVIHG